MQARIYNRACLSLLLQRMVSIETILRIMNPALQENVPLAPLTTLRIGGPARFFTRAGTVEEIRAALDWADERSLPVLLLGGGSNMLVADEGFDGLVLGLALRGIDAVIDGGSVLLSAAAGEEWDPLVELTVERNWAGFECLSGIPGLVGATPIQNVGAYGQEVSESIVDLEALDRVERRLVTFRNKECRFRYRDSRFKSEEKDRYVILSVRYRLTPDGSPALRYPDLERAIAEGGISSPSLRDVREAVLDVRRRKAMVLDKNEPDSRSAGSFFTNPVMSEETYRRFLERVESDAELCDQRVPTYPVAEGGVKISAAWLIERSGFHRGHRHGNVGLSTRHTLAIVNRGGGTAREVMELVRQIQAGVEERFGIRIVPEPNLIGMKSETRTKSRKSADFLTSD